MEPRISTVYLTNTRTRITFPRVGRQRRLLSQSEVDAEGGLIWQSRDGVWDGEHDMEVLGVENLSRPSLEPFGAGQRLTLGTVPIRAGVIRDPLVPTGVALFDMPAEHGGAARFDRRHHPALRG